MNKSKQLFLFALSTNLLLLVGISQSVIAMKRKRDETPELEQNQPPCKKQKIDQKIDRSLEDRIMACARTGDVKTLDEIKNKHAAVLFPDQSASNHHSCDCYESFVWLVPIRNALSLALSLKHYKLAAYFLDKFFSKEPYQIYFHDYGLEMTVDDLIPVKTPVVDLGPVKFLFNTWHQVRAGELNTALIQALKQGDFEFAKKIMNMANGEYIDDWLTTEGFTEILKPHEDKPTQKTVREILKNFPKYNQFLTRLYAVKVTKNFVQTLKTNDLTVAQLVIEDPACFAMVNTYIRQKDVHDILVCHKNKPSEGSVRQLLSSFLAYVPFANKAIIMAKKSMVKKRSMDPELRNRLLTCARTGDIKKLDEIKNENSAAFIPQTGFIGDDGHNHLSLMNTICDILFYALINKQYDFASHCIDTLFSKSTDPDDDFNYEIITKVADKLAPYATKAMDLEPIKFIFKKKYSDFASDALTDALVSALMQGDLVFAQEIMKHQNSEGIDGMLLFEQIDQIIRAHNNNQPMLEKVTQFLKQCQFNAYIQYSNTLYATRVTKTFVQNLKEDNLTIAQLTVEDPAHVNMIQSHLTPQHVREIITHHRNRPTEEKAHQILESFSAYTVFLERSSAIDKRKKLVWVLKRGNIRAAQFIVRHNLTRQHVDDQLRFEDICEVLKSHAKKPTESTIIAFLRQFKAYDRFWQKYRELRKKH